MLRQLRILVVVFAAALAPVAATEAREAPSAPPQRSLRGTTIIRGSETAFAEVELKQEAKVDLRRRVMRPDGPNQRIETLGRGRFVGIAITHADPRPGRDPLVVAGRFTTCSRPSCASRTRISSIWPGEGDYLFDGSGRVGRYLTLEPGRYRIYLIADGAPATVRLKLLGLGGRAVLEPTVEPDFFQLESPAGALESSATGSKYSAGGTFRGGKEGLFVSLLLLRSETFGNLDWGICHYRGPLGPPSKLAYGRHCSEVAVGAGASASFRDGFTNRKMFAAGLLADYTASDLPPTADGTQGIGAWAESSGPLHFGINHTFVLSYGTV